jgi:hypothetical protein
MNTALAQLQREGHRVQDEDITRLSPLVHDHINVELRPLRDPSNQA